MYNMFKVQPYLFANNIRASVEAAAFIPEIWANRALGRLRKMTVFVSLVTRDFEDIIAKQGDTVNITKRGTLVANDKAENAGVTLQTPSATTIPVVLTDHKEVSFLVEDVAEAQANQSIVDGYVEDAAIVLGEAMDTAVAGIYASLSDAQFTYIGTNAITSDDILAARTTIVTDGPYPATAPRALVIRDMAEMLTIDDFIDRDHMPDANNLADGVVGRVAGFTIFENQNVAKTGTPAETKRLAFPREAIAFVTRRLPNPPANTGVSASTIVSDGIALRVLNGYNMTYLGLQVTLDILFGVKILREELIACISEGEAAS